MILTPDQSNLAFRAHLKNASSELQNLTLKDGLELFVSFFQSHRTDGDESLVEADMLVFQWGDSSRDPNRDTALEPGGNNCDDNDADHDHIQATAHAAPGNRFRVNLARHFVLNDSCDEDELSQLSLTFIYSSAPAALVSDGPALWLKSQQDGLSDWTNRVRQTEIFERFAALKPLEVTLQWFEI